MGEILHGDCLEVLPNLTERADVIYIDPPYGIDADKQFDMPAWSKTTYDHDMVGKILPMIGDYSARKYLSWLYPRLEVGVEALSDTGAMFVHIDRRMVHYVKILMDFLFGEKSFINEIVWSYNSGGGSTKSFNHKHDNILYYVNNPNDYYFDADAVRVPYPHDYTNLKDKLHPLGKNCPDVWDITRLGNSSKERVGYPTQKPVELVERIIKATCPPGGLVLDYFAGSGTTGQAAQNLGRDYVLVDYRLEAVEVMKQRLEKQK